MAVSRETSATLSASVTVISKKNAAITSTGSALDVPIRAGVRPQPREIETVEPVSFTGLVFFAIGFVWGILRLVATLLIPIVLGAAVGWNAAGRGNRSGRSSRASSGDWDY